MESPRHHYTMEELQARVDRRLSGEELDLDAHLAECVRCRDALEAWVRLDRAMRRIPLVHAGSAFTYAVMARIRAGDKSSALDRSLSFIPYFLGLAIVLGIMGGIFWWAGVFQKMKISEGEGQVLEYLAPFLGRISEGVQAASGWLSEHLLTGFSDSILLIALPAVCIVAVIALLDRTLGRWLLGRAR